MTRLSDTETGRLLAQVDGSMAIAERLFGDLAEQTAEDRKSVV